MRRFAFFAFFCLFFMIASGAADAVPSRIVSASPCFTEILFALGVGDRVVGVTKYCDDIKGAEGKKIVGDMNLSLEAVVSLRPDLVIAMPNGKGDNVRILKSKGLNVISMRCDNLSEFRSCVRRIGEVTGSSKRASVLLSEMDSKIASLRAMSKRIDPAKRKRVFVEIWDSPLMTPGKRSHVSEIVSLAGGIGGGDSIDGVCGIVGTEFLYSFDPDVILLLNSRAPGRAWKGLRAVRDGKVFVLDHNRFARISFRMPDLALEIHRMLYGGAK